MTPRSKHFVVKYHYFHEKLIPSLIEIKKVTTDLQLAVFLVKGLGREKFVEMRKLLIRW